VVARPVRRRDQKEKQVDRFTIKAGKVDSRGTHRNRADQAIDVEQHDHALLHRHQAAYVAGRTTRAELGCRAHLGLVHIDDIGDAVDDHTEAVEAWLVAVGNTRSYASGMAITPHASLRDGALDVCVVGPVSRTEFLTTFPKVFSGEHVDHPQVRTWRGERVVIERGGTDRGTDRGALGLELWASGEHLGPLPATLTPAPDALRVVVPRGRTIQ